MKNNAFALADAVGKKSNKDMWLEYIKSRRNNIEPEFLCASVLGKVRDMLLVAGAQAKDLDIHPFVYKKARWDLTNWDRAELQDFYDKLILIYNEVRTMGKDLELEMEKMLLAVGMTSETKNETKRS